MYRERAETAAVLVRVAPSHVRFGSFQLFASRKQADEVRLLADHVIEHHFPECLALPVQQRYAAWYREIVDRTALQQLRAMVRQARAEQSASRPPAAARQLYRRLREILATHERQDTETAP